VNKRDIGKEIIEGLEEIKAWRSGERKLRTTTVELPTASDVLAIRKELGLSQDQLARLMGVSVATLRNWEQGRREPHGPARSLLLVASREPVAVLRALSAVGLSDAGKRVGVAQKTARYRAVSAAHSGVASYEVTPDAGISVSRAALARVCRKYGVRKLSLFGSAARKEMKSTSDVDLLVEFAPDSRASLFDFPAMQRDFSELFGHRRVDLVPPEVLKNPYRRKAILPDLRVLYASHRR
jgi:DNA-binding transcriptional regulator YiaG/predicted nucleotidyltransferase